MHSGMGRPLALRRARTPQHLALISALISAMVVAMDAGSRPEMAGRSRPARGRPHVGRGLRQGAGGRGGMSFRPFSGTGRYLGVGSGSEGSRGRAGPGASGIVTAGSRPGLAESAMLRVPQDFATVALAVQDIGGNDIRVERGDHEWNGQLVVDKRGVKLAADTRATLNGRWLLRHGSAGTVSTAFMISEGAPSKSCVYTLGGPWEFNSCKLFSTEGIALLSAAHSSTILQHCSVGGKRDEIQCSTAIYLAGNSSCNVKGGMVKNAQCGGIRCSGEAQCSMTDTIWRGNGVNAILSGNASLEVSKCRFGKADLACLHAEGGHTAKLSMNLCKVYGKAWVGDGRPSSLDVRASSFVEDTSAHSSMGQSVTWAGGKAAKARETDESDKEVIIKGGGGDFQEDETIARPGQKRKREGGDDAIAIDAEEGKEELRQRNAPESKAGPDGGGRRTGAVGTKSEGGGMGAKWSSQDGRGRDSLLDSDGASDGPDENGTQGRAPQGAASAKGARTQKKSHESVAVGNSQDEGSVSGGNENLADGISAKDAHRVERLQATVAANRMYAGGTKTQKRNQRRRRKIALVELSTGNVHDKFGDRGPAGVYDEKGPLDHILHPNGRAVAEEGGDREGDEEDWWNDEEDWADAADGDGADRGDSTRPGKGERHSDGDAGGPSAEQHQENGADQTMDGVAPRPRKAGSSWANASMGSNATAAEMGKPDKKGGWFTGIGSGIVQKVVRSEAVWGNSGLEQHALYKNKTIAAHPLLMRRALLRAHGQDHHGTVAVEDGKVVVSGHKGRAEAEHTGDLGSATSEFSFSWKAKSRKPRNRIAWREGHRRGGNRRQNVEDLGWHGELTGMAKEIAVGSIEF